MMTSLRGAVFAPFPNLRTVYVEEERDRHHCGAKEAKQ